jgi:hypothetical protein
MGLFKRKDGVNSFSGSVGRVGPLPEEKTEEEKTEIRMNQKKAKACFMNNKLEELNKNFNSSYVFDPELEMYLDYHCQDSKISHLINEKKSFIKLGDRLVLMNILKAD